jgi:hypothetical protein
LTIKDIISLALDKKFTYDEAITELKKLKLPIEEEESYEIILHKILGKEDSINHLRPLSLNSIPNECYFELMTETIKLVRAGLFSPDICQHLFDNYGLSASLINYFVNEAISIVRMNTISDSEFVEIGEKYEQIKRNIIDMISVNNMANNNNNEEEIQNDDFNNEEDLN